MSISDAAEFKFISGERKDNGDIEKRLHIIAGILKETTRFIHLGT